MRKTLFFPQIDHIHRAGCSALNVAKDGRHLVTAGDKVLKVWDYSMKLDLNFQVCLIADILEQSCLFNPPSGIHRACRVYQLRGLYAGQPEFRQRW
jgi:hypothetical protein